MVNSITADLDRRLGARLIEELISRYLPIVDPVWEDLTEVIATMLANRSLVRVTYAFLDKLVTNSLVLRYPLEQLLPQAGHSD